MITRIYSQEPDIVSLHREGDFEIQMWFDTKNTLKTGFDCYSYMVISNENGKVWSGDYFFPTPYANTESKMFDELLLFVELPVNPT